MGYADLYEKYNKGAGFPPRHKCPGFHPVKKMNEWKQLIVEMPPNMTRCLVIPENYKNSPTKWSGITDAIYDQSRGWIKRETEECTIKVKYWMPLPQPPQD